MDQGSLGTTSRILDTIRWVLVTVGVVAILGLLAFYALCVIITWFYYTRRNAPVPC